MTDKGVTITGFEGPEKRLEVDFKRNAARPLGLRTICKDQWQEMLNFSACTIIGHTPNEHFDAYVLSESSLFVYPYKLMIKTCGTTTLLKIIPKLLEYAQTCDLEVELVMYSRKNFLFPKEQLFPHTDWRAELSYLDEYFDGSSYILGPLTGDHWYMYLADYADNKTDEGSTKESTLEIMMHNLEPEAAQQFYRKENTDDRDKFPGIAEIIPGQVTDEFNFTPCGYSMNGLLNHVYSTIHVTPEPHCSYASFETNLALPCYKKLISYVFSIFRPGSVTVTLFHEKADDVNKATVDLDIPGYMLRYKTHSELGCNRDVLLCQYESLEFNAARQNSKKIPLRSVQTQLSHIL